MIARVTFELEDGDPPWETHVDEAFNRVINFCPELLPPRSKVGKKKAERSLELQAFKRLRANAFDLDDVQTLRKYGETVRRRILDHYAHADPALAQVKASTEQAAANLLQIVNEFTRWFTAVQDQTSTKGDRPADAAHVASQRNIPFS
jgi:hypothetical protein